jgi:ATP-dependent exoDNAse (exonuclease V) beta subunit
MAWSPVASDGVLACSEALGIKSSDIGFYQHLNKISAEREYQELIRIVYVGVTRAKKHAYLLGRVSYKDEVLSVPGKGTMFGVIYHEQININLHETNAIRQADVIKPYVKVIDANIDVELPVRNTLAAYRGSNKLKVGSTTKQWLSPAARVEGVVLHQLIEQINKDGVENWDNALVDQYSSIILAALKELPIEKNQLLATVNRIKGEIKDLLACDIFRALSATNNRGDVELKLALKQNKRINMLRIDKGYMSSDGVAHIVDWKSGQLVDGQSVNNYIHSQKALYREKMKMYQDAYAQVKNAKRGDSALYFTKNNILEKCN